MKISVIVPTYKPKSYIWECLDSIYNQTLPKNDYELILVLNGCNEPYSTQIRAWLSKHESLGVQFIQTDESGDSNARNLALDHVKGEYVTFIDDDDFISCVIHTLSIAEHWTNNCPIKSPKHIIIVKNTNARDFHLKLENSFLGHA